MSLTRKRGLRDSYADKLRREGIPQKARKPLRKVSAKNWWEKLRPKLKVEFERAGITTCELRYAGCWHDNGLGFAHSKKRRFITHEKERREVVLACNKCHDILEGSSHEIMLNEVRKVIDCRDPNSEWNRAA